MRLPCLFLVLTFLLGGLTGCASLTKPHNDPVQKISNQGGYRMMNTRGGAYGDHLIFLAFSGGGTRAAALAYGVLQEMRDTEVDSDGKRIRLLDEVDSISSVSGGSFTAAYYGLFRDRLFTDFEKVFLRQSIQGALIRELFDPVFWWESLFSGLDRTEMAIEYYDSNIFERKTFADIDLARGPMIEINATDLGGGNQFSFVQPTFDLICSDLASFPVARAVTASSAVPIAFPTVVLKNYAGECDSRDATVLRNLEIGRDANDKRTEALYRRNQSYTDAKARPYLHLVDGGISDNLGLRAMIDRVGTFNVQRAFLDRGRKLPKKVVVISVNAEVKPERSIDYSASKPSVVDTLDALSDVQISLYNDDTRALMPQKLKVFVDELNSRGHDAKPYFVEVSFESLKAKTLKSYFNNLPTSLELSDHDVDMLIAAGRDLLRRSPQFQTFLSDSGGVSPTGQGLDSVAVTASGARPAPP